jgi:hypothetical protein
MASSDIYESKELPGAKNEDALLTSQRRRRSRRSPQSFDEVINEDVSETHRRRCRNTGLRRFQHLMRKPEFNKKFWTITLSIFGLILALLLLWDRFLRYPNQEPGYEPDTYRTVIQ